MEAEGLSSEKVLELKLDPSTALLPLLCVVWLVQRVLCLCPGCICHGLLRCWPWTKEGLCAGRVLDMPSRMRLPASDAYAGPSC